VKSRDLTVNHRRRAENLARCNNVESYMILYHDELGRSNLTLGKHELTSVGETASQFSPSPGSVHADRTFSLRSVQPHGLQRV